MPAYEQPRVFTRRIGKVLAMSRLILAVVFLLALWIDPLQPARSPKAGFVILGLYLIWAVSLLGVAWKSWWYDFRMARMAHVVDLIAFIAACYVTERINGDFSSPFLCFAAFLLIGAALRWGWTGVAWTASGLVVANAAVGGILLATHIQFNLFRFGRRQTYMIVLSIMMVWLTGNRRTPRIAPMPEPAGVAGERRTRVMAGVLEHARAILNAHSAALALGRGEEPGVDLLVNQRGVVVEQRLTNEDLDEALGTDDPPALFDIQRKRHIVLGANDFAEIRPEPFAMPLARLCDVNEGVAVTFSFSSGNGQLLVWGIPDICTDDLPVASVLAHEIGMALDREAMAQLSRSSAVSDVRNAIARDLHDSVAQFLAGTLFRLEALRRWIHTGNEPDAEIDTMKEALRREQAQLRVMVDRLRRGVEGDRSTDLGEELSSLLVEMGKHWRISTRLETLRGAVSVSMQLAYELRQIVREAVANAARHGRCSHVEICLSQEDPAHLRMAICDDGCGFPQETGQIRPRSICERVEALGGQVNLSNTAPGARLDILLPTRMDA